jgi:hypothetical protein
MRHERKRTALALAVLSLLLPPVFGRQWFMAVSGGVGARGAAGASSCPTYADRETEMSPVPGATFEMRTEESEVNNLMLAFGVKRADGLASESPRHTVPLGVLHPDRRGAHSSECAVVLARGVDGRADASSPNPTPAAAPPPRIKPASTRGRLCGRMARRGQDPKI